MTHAAKGFQIIKSADERIAYLSDKIVELHLEVESLDNLGQSDDAEARRILADELTREAQALYQKAQVAGRAVSLMSRLN